VQQEDVVGAETHRVELATELVKGIRPKAAGDQGPEMLRT
jgi:hypothetical protein